MAAPVVGDSGIELLSAKQARFARSVALLILMANELGYAVTFGEAYRSAPEAERLAAGGRGIANSLHCDRLAVDLNLFKDGKYLSDTESHRPLGELWESFGPDYRWGGRFGDGNHYSIEHQGRK